MNIETINHFNKLITSAENMTESGSRVWYRVGEHFLVEVSRVDHDLKNKNDLMNPWKSHGFIETALPTHINVSTYFTDCDGNCWGKYNITHNQGKLDFSYLREWNQENINELVAECIRLYEMDIA